MNRKKIAYFDCSAGVSGDMFLGSLMDAGLDFNWFKREIAKLKLSGYSLRIKKVMRGPIQGTQVVVDVKTRQRPRHFRDIKALILKSRISDTAKKRAIEIFHDLAKAEAKIHGQRIEDIHFHEVGAVDAMIDVVGTVVGLEKLGIQRVLASRVHLGEGFVQCQHGTLPLPAPAAIELLKGIPVYSTGIEREMATPTGAAILKNITGRFGPVPAMRIERIGYGAGQHILPIPNVLRLLIGWETDSGFLDEKVCVVETNIDDMNPEIFEHALECLKAAGALDVYMTPVFMKKNRPGTLLTAIVAEENLRAVMDVFFRETTTLGVRVSQVERRVLKREMLKVRTKWGHVSVKVSRYQGEVVNAAPEYESCRALARKHNIPLKKIYQEAQKVSPVNPRS